MFTIVSLIVDTIATVLGGVLLLRFWMQAVRVRPPAPVGQFTFQLSDWLVLPLRRVIPGVGGYDWASLLAALVVVLLAQSIHLIIGWPIESVFVNGVYRFFQWITYGFMALLIIEVVFSWINPHAPMAPFVRALNSSLLRPLRNIVPLIGGLDMSVLVAVILIQIVQYLIHSGFRLIPYFIDV